MKLPGPEAAAKQSTSRTLTPCRSSRRAQVTVEHVAEAFGGVQQHFLQRFPGAREGEAAEFVRGIDGEDEFVHWVSW